MSLEDTVARAVAAYGGAERWQSATTVTTRVGMSGLLFRMKKTPLPPSIRITTTLAEPRSRLEPIDAQGNVAVLEGLDVRLERPDGEVIEHRENVRERLPGPGRFGRPWDRVEVAYFLGYAFWGYNAMIRWLLHDDVQRRELAPDVLELTFPREWPVHSHTQRFYFDDHGLLKRNDYHANVVTSQERAWVANQVKEHRRSEGIPYPAVRRVTMAPKPMKPPTPGPTLVGIRMADWRLV